ncbi:hypothetical protein HORM4_740002 [Vibrio harveyi]|nr:hypothetical protein HORM4_740002 [Vibrio harveyi]
MIEVSDKISGQTYLLALNAAEELAEMAENQKNRLSRFGA